jgi:hypothetical protein
LIEFASGHWPGEDPVGRRIRLKGGYGQYLIVVGVVTGIHASVVLKSSKQT